MRINSYLNSISLNKIQALKEKFILNKIDYEVFISELDYEFQWRNLIFNKYSNKINHGEAVIMGMMLAVKLSYLKKACNKVVLNEIIQIYKNNNLNYRIEKFFKKNEYNQIIDNMSNDKKNNDEKINFILLKKIGKTTRPDKNKNSIKEIKRLFPKIISI